MLIDHVIRVRDRRSRFGDPETSRAECSCGWRGTDFTGRLSENEARREGMRHCDDERPPRDTS